MSEGNEHLTAGNVDMAVEAYGAAKVLVPDNHEMVSWHAVTLAGAGQVEQALPLFREAFAKWPRWR